MNIDIWSRDCCGNELQIGDTVVGIAQAYFAPLLRKGKIIGFSNLTKERNRFFVDGEQKFLYVQKYKVEWTENHMRFRDCPKYCPKQSIVLADSLMKV